jgi:hypothetical protein
MRPIVEHLRSYPEIKNVLVVVGNTPFNRYLAMQALRNYVFGCEVGLYTQDDDCITDIRPLLNAYVGKATVINAMTPQHAAQYPGRQTLIGFGAIFSDQALSCFSRGWVLDELFYRESDRIFATVNEHQTLFPKIEILPHANAENRLWRQPDHVPSRLAMEKRILEVTGIAA